jgi:hypothetical protein
MKGSSSLKGMKILFFIPLVLFLFSSCEQYEYTNPNPGLVQINLRSVYTQFDTVFALNNFTIKVTQIQAKRKDGSRANIYLEPKAIDKQPTVYNVLGKKAYDSTEVIGQYPLPPGEYTSLTFLIEPGLTVILDGYRRIRVDKPLDYSAFVEIEKAFVVEESRTTQLTLAADLDRTLRRLAYTFEYNPSYSISSTRVY